MAIETNQKNEKISTIQMDRGTAKQFIIQTIEGDGLLVPNILGPHGIGKTSLIHDIGKELNKPVLTISLTAIEPIDFTGRNYTDENNITQWAKPGFLNHSGILFLDEANRVTNSDIRSCLNSLIIDRKVNGHELNPDCSIVLAGNIGDEYEVSDFDPSLKDRLLTFVLRTKIQDWIMYEGSIRPSEFVKFVESNSNLLQRFSFRILTEANKHFLKWGHRNIEVYTNMSISVQFGDFIRYDNLSLADVIEGDLKKLDSTHKTKLLQVANEASEKLKDQKVTDDQLKNIKTFVTEIPDECKLSFFSGIKKISETTPISEFQSMAKRLKDLRFFDGALKDYLDVVMGVEDGPKK